MIKLIDVYWNDEDFIRKRISEQMEEYSNVNRRYTKYLIRGEKVDETRKKELLDSIWFIMERFEKRLRELSIINNDKDRILADMSS